MAFHNIPPNGFPDIPDMEELEAVVKDVNNLSDNKANQITIAPFFNPEASYEVGDLVYYNGLSYRCTNDHEGEWDADDFAATTVAGELATLKSGLTNLVKRGSFRITCAAGQNVFRRSDATLVSGEFPPDMRYAMYNVCMHASSQNSPNTVEADSKDTLIINAVSAQDIGVVWLDISGVST